MSDLHLPQHHVRVVTASALFDGHDAAINIMRRILQSQGAEVIHLGHNRAVREVVDAVRAKGHRMGLLKIRYVRPFPDKRVAELLKGRKAVGVVDKSVCFGRRKGIVYEEVMAALAEHGVSVPSCAFVAGLGGYDIREEHLLYATESIQACASSGSSPGNAVFLINQGCTGA